MSDIDALQGIWKVTALEFDGNAMPAFMLGAATIVVNGDHFSTSGMGATYEGSVVLDAAQSPKHFTLTFDQGPEKGNSNPGIYELDGDKWRLCLATRGGARPTEFATKSGSGHACETLERAV